MTSSVPAFEPPLRNPGSPSPEGTPWHALDVSDCLTHLRTDGRRGLSTEQAQRRLDAFGVNELTDRGGDSRWMTFLRQFHQPLVYILLGAAALTAALNEPVDAAIILGVVLLNAMIGFVQEYKAMTAIAALARRVSAAWK